jgi:hypothetical protein
VVAATPHRELLRTSNYREPLGLTETVIQFRKRYAQQLLRRMQGADYRSIVGIGCEFARQLAPVASTMILVARRNDRLEVLESELRVINPQLELFSQPLDLRDQAEVESFCDWLHESGPTVNLLINNAGLGDHGPFVDSEWERVDSNGFGT